MHYTNQLAIQSALSVSTDNPVFIVLEIDVLVSKFIFFTL